MSSFNEAMDRRAENEGRKRLDLIVAATKGVREHLQSMRGANDFAHAKIVTTSKGFCVVYGADERVYFETTTM